MDYHCSTGGCGSFERSTVGDFFFGAVFACNYGGNVFSKAF